MSRRKKRKLSRKKCRWGKLKRPVDGRVCKRRPAEVAVSWSVRHGRKLPKWATKKHRKGTIAAETVKWVKKGYSKRQAERAARRSSTRGRAEARRYREECLARGWVMRSGYCRNPAWDRT